MKLKNNILYVGLAVAGVIFAYPVLSRQAAGNYADINSTEFSKKLNDKEVTIIDVRTPGEVQNGYIKGADLFIDFYAPDFTERLSKLDKNKIYYVYCQSGVRSAKASTIMTNNGFKNVYNLLGGFGSWKGETTR